MEYTLEELKTITVLYVEDEKQIRDTIFRTFEKLFKKVYLASDGQEGMDIFNKNKDEIEVIVTDINMPRLNGIEMITAICATNTLPIVVTTAHTDKQYLMQAIELNIDSYITKPVKIKELTNTIGKLVLEYRKTKHKDVATAHLISKTKEINNEKNIYKHNQI